jgi:hypothetical protein
MHTRARDRKGPGAPRASRVVVVLAWALAMLVAGAVTSWAVTVISGEQGPARDQVLAASQVTAELAAQRAASSAAATAPATSSPPSPAAVPTVESPDDPSPTASALPAVTPPAAPETSDPAAPLGAPTTSSAEVARTWDVAGGQVGASCRGPVLRLLYATPVDGWSVEVKHAGSDELEVAFRQDPAETTVHAACVDGIPTQENDRD